MKKFNHAKDLARRLQDKYYNYYCTVYFDFIVEAVENALNDLEGVCDLEELHACIKENYI